MSTLETLFKSNRSKQLSDVGGEETEQFGLFPLGDYTEQSRNLDIVAVHGLGGHWAETWTAENGRIWLRDSVPAKLHDIGVHARIFSYGYNASTAFSKAVTDITDEAGMLLDRIKGERKSESEQRRPIIFVAHSLGGILVKKAMIIAHERTREYGQLLESVKGSMFLGTPHRGSDAAYWGTFGARLLRALQLGRGTNTSYVSALQRNSAEFAHISEQWTERAASLRIRTFYETETTHGEIVVDKDSARLGLVNEVAIGVAGADHRSICKFPHLHGQRYKPVSDAVEDLAQIAVGSLASSSQKLSPEESQCLRVLYTSDYEGHRLRNPVREAGTCEWIFKDEKYDFWNRAPEASLMWISADPGCGKSVLASFLVEHFKSFAAKCQLAVAHFFFKSDNEDQRSANKALCAILHQLFSANPALTKYATAEYTRKGSRLSSDFSGLRDILFHATEDPTCGPVVLIIDGLDECEKSSKEQFLDIIMRLYPNKPVKHCTKTIVASRPYSEIRTCMQKSPTIWLKPESRLDAIDDDVKRVVRARLRRLTAQFDTSDPVSFRRIEAMLLQRANHTFLWVSLILDLIDRCTSWASAAEVFEVIAGPHDDLDTLYESVLAKSPNPSKARKLLHIVLGAAEPLTIEELDTACAVRLGDKTMADMKDRRFFSAENGIRDACGLFLRFIYGIAFFVHDTAREFLLAQTNAELSEHPSANLIHSQTTWKHSFNLRESHTLMADICIAYLLLDEFDGQIYCWGFQGLFNHASIRWPSYFRLAQDVATVESRNAVSRLLSDEGGERLWVQFWTLPGIHGNPCANGNTECLPSGFYEKAAYLGFHDLAAQQPAEYYSSQQELYSPLFHAIMMRELRTVELLCCNRALVTSNNDALLACVLRRDTNTAELLLSSGASPDQVNRSKPNFLHEAARIGDREMMNVLLQYGADIDLLHRLCEGNDLFGSRIVPFIAFHRWFRMPRHVLSFDDCNYKSPLSFAARRCNKNAVWLLLNRKANPRTRSTRFKYTPLHEVAQSIADTSEVDDLCCIVDFLIDAGADPIARDEHARTPLDVAMLHYKDLRFVAKLLDSVAQATSAAEYQNMLWDTLISWDHEFAPQAISSHLCTRKYYTGLVQLLIEKGLAIERRNLSQRTLLMEAVLQNSTWLVRALLHVGADINAVNGEGKTALSLCPSSDFGMVGDIRDLFSSALRGEAESKEVYTVSQIDSSVTSLAQPKAIRPHQPTRVTFLLPKEEWDCAQWASFGESGKGVLQQNQSNDRAATATPIPR